MGHRHYRWLWLVSGAAAAVIVFFLFFDRESVVMKTVQPVAQNTVSTKSGSKSKIQLPDGSQVWLNADSRLTYNETFSGAFREVQLIGEAYFDITKDKGHPFLIHTSSVDIRVLGTSLNVRSYTNEKNSETVLIHGSIEVTLRNNPDKKIILKPNEKLVVQNGAATIDHSSVASQGHHQEEEPLMTLGKAHYKQKDSIATEVLWVKNKLAFDKETLESVALKIERWYDVKVIITDESLKNTEYSGVFEDENVRQVMEALRLSGNFKYTINKKEITIKP
jgi:ferric-dicitrate binding protein FerR (iron transport regulator)